MKINDVIHNCLETPGISLKQNDYSTELLMNNYDGKGSITFFPLFPGITLAYIFVNASVWEAPDMHENAPNGKGLLLFNYCVEGRCELVLNNQNYVYVKDNEISLTEHYAGKQYVYPRHIYEGLEIFIDTDMVLQQCSYIQTEFDILFHKITDLYCPDEDTYISPAPTEITDILDKLWGLFDLPMPFALSQMKLYTLALFSTLLNLKDIPKSQICTFFSETQVNIAKRVEKIITADLRQHHPAWELASMFSISETSLKNYFRGVFGQNISIYLRELRMNTAAKLLETTMLPISEIAEQVGYLNQSKFATAFKKQFTLSPLEYRRSKALKSSM
jgi:AraC-like DNA-binding protein